MFVQRKVGKKVRLLKVQDQFQFQKLNYFVPKCGKGVRVGYDTKGEKKARVCKKCGAQI
jgi:large subunit ribosomal protein L24